MDTFTARMLGAINDMLLDILAAVARKDYEDRRRWQMDGIKTAKDQGAYKGRGVDQDKHQRILECLSKGMGVRETARTTGQARQPSSVRRSSSNRRFRAALHKISNSVLV